MRLKRTGKHRPRLAGSAVLCAALTFAAAGFAQDTEPTDTEPTDTEPTDTEPTDTEPTDTEAAAQEIVPPDLLVDIAADYPADAFAEELQADVLLQIDIDVEGAVSNIVPLEVTYYWYDEEGYLQQETSPPTPDDWGFVASAVAAMEQYSYSAAILIDAENPDGIAIPVQVAWNIGFVIEVEEIVRDVDVEQDYDNSEPDGIDGEDPASLVNADGPVNFSGRLLERGTRDPLDGFVVVATLTDEAGEILVTVETASDADGRFAFGGLPDGEWSVTVDEVGYESYAVSESISRAELTDATYYVEESNFGSYSSRTTSEAPRREVTRQTIQVAEIQRIPGNNNDAIRVVQNLPGVARPSFGGGDVIIRGSAPEDTRFFVDSMEIPLLYHFGGIRSVFPSEMLSEINLYPGAYGAEFGRATGGVVAVELSDPDNENYHGYVDANLFDTGIFLEGPIANKLSFQVGARRSYIDLILLPLADALELNFATAPRYWDYQVKLRYEVNANNDLMLFYFASDDLIDFVLADEVELPPEQRGGIRFASGFQTVQLSLNSRINDTLSNEFRSQLSFPQIEFNLGTDLFFELSNTQFSHRDTLSWQASERVLTRIGFDVVHGSVDVNVRLPRLPQEGAEATSFEADEVLEVSETVNYAQPAGFLEFDLEPIDGLHIVPGVRVDYFTFSDNLGVDLRLSSRYQINDDWVVKAGFGTFHQPPTPAEASEGFGNPDLELERAIHYVAGVEHSLTDYLNVNVELFYKDLDNLVSGSNNTVERDGETVLEVYNNEGEGRIFGAEVLVRHQLANNFFGWIAYTLSRSERLDSGETDLRLFDFDQTHIFTVLGSYNLPRNWSVGLRWRLVSGNPTTPIIGSVFDADNNTYIRVAGEPNSVRQPAFHQLDVRVDKRWVYNRWTLNVYLDLQNAYNRQNQEDVAYSYDYTQEAPITGLPIIPSFGIRGEF